MQTERLIIRPARESDFGDICEFGCDEETGKYMIFWPKSREQIKEFLQKYVKESYGERQSRYEFVLQLKEENKVIGIITLSLKGQEGEIGWISNKQYWGRGYMTEAVRAVLEYAFQKIRVKEITATCSGENRGSYRVMEKCGMSRIGEATKCRGVKAGKVVIYNKLTYHIVNNC